MTGRTRWDALAEEIAEPAETSRVEPKLSPEGPATFDKPRPRFSTVTVVVEGMAIGPVTDVKLSMETNYDRLGAGYGSEIVKTGSPTVRGSFCTARRDLKFAGKELTIYVTRENEDPSIFQMHVTQMQWSLNGPTTVTVVGTWVA